MLSLQGRFGLEAFELRLELRDVVELSIDRRKADVSHPVELLEPAQGQLADSPGVGGAARRAKLGDDPGPERGGLRALDRRCARAAFEARQQLGAVEGLPRSVVLAYVEGALVVALVGGE